MEFHPKLDREIIGRLKLRHAEMAVLTMTISKEWAEALVRNAVHYARPIEIGEYKDVMKHLDGILADCDKAMGLDFFRFFRQEINSCEPYQLRTVITCLQALAKKLTDIKNKGARNEKT